MLNRNKYSPRVMSEIKHYDTNAEFVSKASKTDFVWQVPEKMLFIDKYLRKSGKWTLLDLGCGSAANIKRNILPYLSRDSKYIGVDVSTKLLKKAKQNVPCGTFINLPMSKLDFPKNSIDYISFFGSLHHDDNPEITIEKVSSFLKRNGFIFFREPNEKAFKKGFGFSPCEAGIKEDKLKKWLSDSGLKIIEWHYLNTLPYHKIKKFCNKVHLNIWENSILLWKVKVKMELIMEKLFARVLPGLSGKDMFIVAKKI